VIGSLWAAYAPSTALLMVRLHQKLLAGQETAAALREAQQWLRRLDRAGALAAVAQPPCSNGPKLPDWLLKKYHTWLQEQPERPFEHPYYWAVFAAYGSPEAVMAAQEHPYGGDGIAEA
jgi:CHAT domain-containing protein